MPDEQQQQEEAAFEKLMALREGRRNDVYLDTLKKLTVGIGHLVLPEDNLKLYDVISDERVSTFFAKDGAAALEAARAQAVEAGITDSSFIPYLASVNFQLGVKWTATFPHTWKMIVDGDYEDAAQALDGTTWSRRTPVRVKDFRMRSEGFPQRARFCLRPLVLGLTFAVLASTPIAGATAQSSFIYCLNHEGAKIFAGREEPNGSLTFGISVWSPDGQNISVFGVAARQGHGWQYTEDLHAPTAADRCQLDIVHGSRGTLRIAANPHAACQSHGGVNAVIGTILFPRTAYEGPVTNELNDPESFQKAGKCVGTQN
jgi:GH24 family phage-related lysozyme (muramidase)